MVWRVVGRVGVEPDRAVLACRVVEPDEWCRRCGCEGLPRDTLTRRLAHEAFGWRPTTLVVTVRRYRCIGCGHVWRQDTSKAAQPRAKLSRRGLRWALEGIVCQHLSVARIAEGLGVSWNTANAAVLAEGQRVLIDDLPQSRITRRVGPVPAHRFPDSPMQCSPAAPRNVCTTGAPAYAREFAGPECRRPRRSKARSVGEPMLTRKAGGVAVVQSPIIIALATPPWKVSNSQPAVCQRS